MWRAAANTDRLPERFLLQLNLKFSLHLLPVLLSSTCQPSVCYPPWTAFLFIF